MCAHSWSMVRRGLPLGMMCLAFASGPCIAIYLASSTSFATVMPFSSKMNSAGADMPNVSTPRSRRHHPGAFPLQGRVHVEDGQVLARQDERGRATSALHGVH